LGEDEAKLLLARAIQMFMPGLPQVWYLDLFGGTNDYAAAQAGGAASHKEINRTTLTEQDIEDGLQRPVVQRQLELIRLRNTSPVFEGQLEVLPCESHQLALSWSHEQERLTLYADLSAISFRVEQHKGGQSKVLMVSNQGER
jgi:sucrose phosphorylase